MKPDTDPNVFLSEMNQMRDELGVLDKTVSTEYLTTIILDALPAEMYSTVKLEATRGSDLSLEQIQQMMRTIFINHSERLYVTKNNLESKRYQESNRRGRENGRESAMSTVFITYHYRKKPGQKVRDCKRSWREYMSWKNQENSIMRERKSVVTIKQTVIRIISSATSKWESRKNSKMEGGKNGVACTIARVIQIKNAFSRRRVAVNVRTVLLLMVEIAKNIKPIL